MKKVVVKRRVVQNKVNLVGICHITQTKSNIFVVLEDMGESRVILERSGGKLGYKGTSKNTRFVAELLGKEIGVKGLELGYKIVKVSIKGGVSTITRGVVNGLVSSGLELKELKFVRSVAHNGVRPKKQRRV